MARRLTDLVKGSLLLLRLPDSSVRRLLLKATLHVSERLKYMVTSVLNDYQTIIVISLTLSNVVPTRGTERLSGDREPDFVLHLTAYEFWDRTKY